MNIRSHSDRQGRAGCVTQFERIDALVECIDYGTVRLSGECGGKSINQTQLKLRQLCTKRFAREADPVLWGFRQRRHLYA